MFQPVLVRQTGSIRHEPAVTMFQRDLRVGWFWIFFLFIVSGEVNANLVQWDLHDVAFDDGGTATGEVTFDSPEDYPFNLDNPILYDVQTSGGRTRPTLYTLGTADALLRFGGFGVEEILFCNPFEATFQHQCLHLVLPELLPSNAGVVQLSVCRPSPPMDCPGVEETGFFGDLLRHGISGELIGRPVPEASTAAFFIAGLFVAVGIRLCRSILCRGVDRGYKGKIGPKG